LNLWLRSSLVPPPVQAFPCLAPFANFVGDFTTPPPLAGLHSLRGMEESSRSRLFHSMFTTIPTFFLRDEDFQAFLPTFFQRLHPAERSGLFLDSGPQERARSPRELPPIAQVRETFVALSDRYLDFLPPCAAAIPVRTDLDYFGLLPGGDAPSRPLRTRAALCFA